MCKAPKPIAAPDLKLHFKRMRRKLLEADMGKLGSKFPDHRAGRALFLELEQFEPTVADLEVASPLIAALVKIMKTSMSASPFLNALPALATSRWVRKHCLFSRLGFVSRAHQLPTNPAPPIF